MKFNKELITYLISGGITTGVNYILYGTLLFLHVPYLTANSIAWVGAVLTARSQGNSVHLPGCGFSPCWLKTFFSRS